MIVLKFYVVIKGFILKQNKLNTLHCHSLDVHGVIDWLLPTGFQHVLPSKLFKIAIGLKTSILTSKISGALFLISKRPILFFNAIRKKNAVHTRYAENFMSNTRFRIDALKGLIK